MAVGKFDFGQDFGRAGPAPLMPSAAEQARRDAERRARAQGYAEGLAEGRVRAERELDQRLALAADSLGALLDGLDRIEEAAAAEAVAFARRFSASAAGLALRRFPLEALDAAARETFAQASRTPHCVVRVNAELVDSANDLLARVARERGFEGRVIVMGEPDVAIGDFAIEWADGGLRRDGAALRRALDEAIERHVSAAADGSLS